MIHNGPVCLRVFNRKDHDFLVKSIKLFNLYIVATKACFENIFRII